MTRGCCLGVGRLWVVQADPMGAGVDEAEERVKLTLFNGMKLMAMFTLYFDLAFDQQTFE